MDWDVFISHAWEDKESIARPLAKALERAGLRVWYDEFTLDVGDSLRRSIDRGLANSKYGIVILSPNFFNKEWPQKELDGLAAREVLGQKIILPIWHNLTADQVRQYSPTLADRLAVSSSHGLQHVVAELLRAVGSPVRQSSVLSSPTNTKSFLGLSNGKKFLYLLILLGVLGIFSFAFWFAFSSSTFTPIALNTEASKTPTTIMTLGAVSNLTPTPFLTSSSSVTPSATNALPSATRTFLPTTRPSPTRTQVAVAPQPIASPTKLPYVLELKDTLLLFRSADSVPSRRQGDGYVSNRKKILISEGELGPQANARKIRIWIRIGEGGVFADGQIKYKYEVVFPITMHSTVDSDVGQLYVQWPAEDVGSGVFVIECWVDEGVLRR